MKPTAANAVEIAASLDWVVGKNLVVECAQEGEILAEAKCLPYEDRRQRGLLEEHKKNCMVDFRQT